MLVCHQQLWTGGSDRTIHLRSTTRPGYLWLSCHCWVVWSEQGKRALVGVHDAAVVYVWHYTHTKKWPYLQNRQNCAVYILAVNELIYFILMQRSSWSMDWSQVDNLGFGWCSLAPVIYHMSATLQSNEQVEVLVHNVYVERGSCSCCSFSNWLLCC